MHTSSTKKKNVQMSHVRIMHILFHEVVVCGKGTKSKRSYLTSVGNIVIQL